MEIIEKENTKQQPINATGLWRVQRLLSSICIFNKLLIVSLIILPDFSNDDERPSEKLQREEMIKQALQREFREMLQNRMAILLQVSNTLDK